MSATDKSPLRSTYEPICWNFKLLAQHELDGFGGMGEGMAVQVAPDGRRIIWLAHESAPKNFTAVDVSDPRKPRSWCRPTCRSPTCVRTRSRSPATPWRSPISARRLGRSPRASSCSTSRCRRARSQSRSWTAAATTRAAFISSGSATCFTAVFHRILGAHCDGSEML